MVHVVLWVTVAEPRFDRGDAAARPALAGPSSGTRKKAAAASKDSPGRVLAIIFDGMRIDLSDANRRRIGLIEVDSAQRPTRVRTGGTDHFLDWDTALDDGGHLRRCVACGCSDLFRAKAFPQITGFVIVLAFAGAVIGTLGFATTPPMVVAMVMVLVADVAILMFSRQRLVCHRCRSSYHGLPIARYHRSWDRAVAEHHSTAPKPRRRGIRFPKSIRRIRWPRRPAPSATAEQ